MRALRIILSSSILVFEYNVRARYQSEERICFLCVYVGRAWFWYLIVLGRGVQEDGWPMAGGWRNRRPVLASFEPGRTMQQACDPNIYFED